MYYNCCCSPICPLLAVTRDIFWLLIYWCLGYELSLQLSASHDVSDGNRQSKTCDLSPLAIWFLLCSSSWLKTLLAQCTSHASNSHSTQTEILNFPINQVSCSWILCCDWYALHSVWRQTTLWPCPRPFPSVWPRRLISTSI